MQVIQQLQASLSREREKATSVEKELRAEIEKVADPFLILEITLLLFSRWGV